MIEDTNEPSGDLSGGLFVKQPNHNSLNKLKHIVGS